MEMSFKVTILNKNPPLQSVSNIFQMVLNFFSRSSNF